MPNIKPIKVALTQEQDRYQTVYKSLGLIFPDFSHLLYTLNPQTDYILLKPNCIDTKSQAAVTHVDALTAVLDFLQPVWQGRIILAEGSGLGNTMEAFKNFRYMDLKNTFENLEFLDLNYSNSIFVEALDKNLKPFQIKISNTVAEAKLRISVGPPKTHDSVVLTASIKNMAVGSILREDKGKIHQGPRAINRTLVALNQYTYPHLAIIDGWTAMEGDGPVNGQMVETHFAASSTNAVAADTFTAGLLGFNVLEIGYLNLLGAAKIRPLIQPVGADPNEFNFHLKKPSTYLKQIQWN